MGSEQSSQSSKSQNILKSGSKMKEHQRARSASPGPSISSDSDIPYISYTVNRPIGDSPKLSSKSPAHSLRASATPSPRSSPKAPRPKSYAGSSSGHDIVVVKEGAPSMDTLETDAELIRLQKIPSFHPIMRGALNIPNTTIHDPEVLDKLDYQCILRLCQRYQDHLKMCAETVSTEQNALIQRIREIDFAINTLTNMLTERQKKFVKYAEQLSKVTEISNNLQKCQTGLKDVIKNMETLNNMLPPEERLEPFVMVTG
ncbi:BLOC-1-related complex subunit 5 [Trichonephila clavipes]|uniref:BLOC-1-related complex subunit 5 n=1 Tax=Trichonephila inaurata madagascariensis TaxID=2747483 RepID=A0A8X7C5S0_9ARAC|nr:BLOC-1-related complex subunit 5 [Trichonephila clavipes]GFY53464.1 BLOC-1-related complex subunit 5 [Trichonephila inaurata madagascariensis]